ncbi:hypothetical protein N7471_010373 [Penicillium samsonianum]|uniref:uncharacterized protein n=1 Tax=Penicillium samsonianum TaxID=1882272 RepID=UPI0025499312|nr:uncharacterized protein N7471_010373 [Penicillium samsonianum]KAJ6125880.1 hypothetical protein N7471_010373 [Penicillium samsonianum]
MDLTQKEMQYEQMIIESLGFEMRTSRHSSIPDAFKRTFRWVHDPPEGAPASARLISEWLRMRDGMFWVSGKPGSGKSTFMKFLADDPVTEAMLLDWSGSKKLITASYYFWSTGTAIQKSQQGFHRALLYETFQQCPEAILPASKGLRPNLRGNKGPNEWSLKSLHEMLMKATDWGASCVRFCFFIDGLDELGDDQFELCQFLKEVATFPSIKICVSSRPWNVFEEAFGGEPRRKLYMQDLTRNDILEYTRSHIYGHPRWPSLEAAKFHSDDLIEEIEERASGVFLWVYLVVKMLREGLTNRDSFLDIRRRLESFPVELEVFFRQILESVEPFYHCKMSTTMQIALAAEEPLEAVAYYFHDQEYEDENFCFSVPSQLYSSAQKADFEETMKWRLTNRSRGLLEINSNSGTVTFLHRTVVDFLRTQEMSTFLSEKEPQLFNLVLSLLRLFTSTIKQTAPSHERHHSCGAYDSDGRLQFFTSSALRCIQELQPTMTDVTIVHHIIDDLDSGILEFSTGNSL